MFLVDSYLNVLITKLAHFLASVYHNLDKGYTTCVLHQCFSYTDQWPGIL